jgi:thiol:disulfide interchange protein DsbC
MRRAALFTILFLVIIMSSGTFAFVGGGCGEGECKDCHSLDKKEASEILNKWVDNVISVDYAEVPGLWVLEVEKKGRSYPLYVDFSKSYIISGNVVRIRSGENITRQLYNQYNKVDVSKIPLDDALVLGNRGATTKVVVFTDPQCPYCKKLHEELKKVIEKSPDISFFIKLYPLKMHPDAYRISKSIVCARSMKMLEDSFHNRPIPNPSCETPVIDSTLKLVKTLGINSTPTMVFPSGGIVSGYVTAEKILEQISKEKLASSPKR